MAHHFFSLLVLLTFDFCFLSIRYYVAEGVRIYSQETWRLVVGDKGKELVSLYMSEMASSCLEEED